MKLGSSRQFSKSIQKPNFIKMRPVRAEMFQAQRRTEKQADMTKLMVAFISSATAPNISGNYKYLEPTATYVEVLKK
jgi:hypothetical protein